MVFFYYIEATVFAIISFAQLLDFLFITKFYRILCVENYVYKNIYSLLIQLFVKYLRRSSVTTFIRQQHHSSNSRSDSQSSSKTVPPKLDYRSMVSVDDMPELFVSFDSKFRLLFYRTFM